MSIAGVVTDVMAIPSFFILPSLSYTWVIEQACLVR